MKTQQFRRLASVLFLAVSLVITSACSDDDNNPNNNGPLPELTATDADALLFMLEEEKLARDTYTSLNNLWTLNQLANIKDSEQSHMNAIKNLLNRYEIDYDVLPIGEFYNQDLQGLYNQFMNDGAVSEMNALVIGATIEDLDILDLEDFINGTENSALISVFENLQCGSRNHLRSFVSGIENRGGTYAPQFLSQTQYETILQGNHEQCN
ncbi:DUF2202 domain-containing protein [Psychroserpens sp. XS_ASV72]|uniref:DUF2202 domain-containing protein n=1 Tax=Psychroserpens sp. XS_ASV72 TaxID=3241293 RepID=UPI003519591F